jgi:hypothetical protein
MAIVRLEGLSELKKSNDLMGIRARDLRTCCIVPQSTTLPRAPAHGVISLILADILHTERGFGYICRSNARYPYFK